jgi:hypothetical protein
MFSCQLPLNNPPIAFRHRLSLTGRGGGSGACVTRVVPRAFFTRLTDFRALSEESAPRSFAFAFAEESPHISINEGSMNKTTTEKDDLLGGGRFVKEARAQLSYYSSTTERSNGLRGHFSRMAVIDAACCWACCSCI